MAHCAVLTWPGTLQARWLGERIRGEKYCGVLGEMGADAEPCITDDAAAVAAVAARVCCSSHANVVALDDDDDDKPRRHCADDVTDVTAGCDDATLSVE